MTSVVQSVASAALGGVPSVTIAIAATTLGNLIVASVAGGGDATITGVTVADNKANGYSSAVLANGPLAFRCAAINYSHTTIGGVTSVTLTFAGGNMYGIATIQEVNGPTTIDQTGTNITGNPVPQTVTASAVNTGATDFVVTAAGIGAGSATEGIVNPTGYTSAALEQDDAVFAGAGISYRINSSAVTDSATWTASDASAEGALAIASFQGSGGGGDTFLGQACL